MNALNTELTIENVSRTLYRYPPESQHKSLQAWDSADELLIQYVAEHASDFDKEITVLNDEFGALACFLSSSSLRWYSDSKVAHLALHHNLEKNQLSHQDVNTYADLDTLHVASSVIMKLPKSNDFLKAILTQLRDSLPEGALVVTGAKTTAIHTSTLKLFEQYLGETKTSLAKKKSRLIITRVNKTLTARANFPVVWPVKESGIKLFNQSNVFANQQLDIGARLMLQHLPNCQDKRVVDLGCGNGVLGLHALQMKPKTLHFVDESHMATQSARLGVDNLFSEKPELAATKVHYHHSNCLENTEIQNADIILCNPPFHQQQTITDHIAWQMFVESKERLQTGGEFRIVGNRHLNYHDKLKRLFGGYKLITSNKKFVVLASKKR